MIMNAISIFTVAATAIVVDKIIIDRIKLHIACKQVIRTCSTSKISGKSSTGK